MTVCIYKSRLGIFFGIKEKKDKTKLDGFQTSDEKKMMFSLSKNPEIVENVFSLGDGC